MRPGISAGLEATRTIVSATGSVSSTATSSYDVMGEPPLAGVVKTTCTESVPGVTDVMFGAEGLLAETQSSVMLDM